MTYTYYYGVICVGCKRFLKLKSYPTQVEGGLVDVTLGMTLRCGRPECGQVCTYPTADVVYSKSEDEMVPLDQ